MAVQVRKRPGAERQQKERAHLEEGEAIRAEDRHASVLRAKCLHGSGQSAEVGHHRYVGDSTEEQEHPGLQGVDPSRAAHAAATHVDVRDGADREAADPSGQAFFRPAGQDVERVAAALDPDQQVRQHQGDDNGEEQRSQRVRTEAVPH